jgi:hypothetical protein
MSCNTLLLLCEVDPLLCMLVFEEDKEDGCLVDDFELEVEAGALVLYVLLLDLIRFLFLNDDLKVSSNSAGNSNICMYIWKQYLYI